MRSDSDDRCCCCCCCCCWTAVQTAERINHAPFAFQFHPRCRMLLVRSTRHRQSTTQVSSVARQIACSSKAKHRLLGSERCRKRYFDSGGRLISERDMLQHVLSIPAFTSPTKKSSAWRRLNRTILLYYIYFVILYLL